MDVIALSEAGFTAAVAPLGTAITEDQLRLLWRIHPEPVVALDGDKAGIAAAMRLVDLALPLIEAGQSLRFVILPGGMDPDDLIRAQGPGAMQALIDAAQPMVRLLWQRETEGLVLDSPERRASLDKSLRASLKRIADPSVRAHYADAIRDLRTDLFAAGRPQRPATPAMQRRPRTGQSRGWPAPPGPALAATKGTMLAAAGQGVEDHLREAMILAILIAHPSLVPQFEAAIDRLDLTGPGHVALRDTLLHHPGRSPDDFRAALEPAALAALEKLAALPHVRIAPPVQNTQDHALAALCLAEELAKLSARRGIRAEIEEAMHDIEGIADEGVTWRLAQAAAARHDAERSKLDADDTALGDRAALSAHLQDLIDAEVWVKKKR